MKRLLLLTAAAFLTAGMCVAQAPVATTPGLASEVQAGYNGVKPDLLKAAEAMPEAGFQYKPTPDIRTFARIVNHVTEAQFHTCSLLNGTTVAPNSVPSDTASKAEIVAGLKASFDACDRAYGSMTNATAVEMVDAGHGRQRSRIGLAWGNVSHDHEQYAELATYMRLKGLVPPSSEK